MKKIILYGIRGKDKFALVDDVDFELLNQHKWHLSNSGYPRRFLKMNGKRSMHILMHMEIINRPSGFEIDHIDLDRLNCQRSNLRICTSSQNKFNRKKYKVNKTGYKGIYWDEERKKYKAFITANKKRYELGRYSSLDDALKVRLEAETKLFGEYAYQGGNL